MGGGDVTFAYFGSGGISMIVLDKLIEAGFVPSLLVAPPDKPSGRTLALTPPELKVWADEHGLPCIQPKQLKKEIPPALMSPPAGGAWDFFVVMAYGQLLPKALLDIPEHGTLNVHPSLLPKLRGPSPIQSAIVTDEKETGVTIMLLDEEMDHGPILAQASVAPEPWPMRAPDLRDLLGDVGGELLAETLPQWLNGSITPEEQDHSKATYCKKLTKEDGLINLENDAYQNLLKIRGLEPWPGTYFFVEKNGKKMRVKITDAEHNGDTLAIKRVIPEGKKEMEYQDFLKGS